MVDVFNLRKKCNESLLQSYLNNESPIAHHIFRLIEATELIPEERISSNFSLRMSYLSNA